MPPCDFISKVQLYCRVYIHGWLGYKYLGYRISFAVSNVHALYSIVLLCCCVVRGSRSWLHQCSHPAAVRVTIGNRYSQVWCKAASTTEEACGSGFFVTEHCQRDARWTLAVDDHWRVDMPPAGICWA